MHCARVSLWRVSQVAESGHYRQVQEMSSVNFLHLHLHILHLLHFLCLLHLHLDLFFLLLPILIHIHHLNSQIYYFKYYNIWGLVLALCFYGPTKPRVSCMYTYMLVDLLSIKEQNYILLKKRGWSRAAAAAATGGWRGRRGRRPFCLHRPGARPLPPGNVQRQPRNGCVRTLFSCACLWYGGLSSADWKNISCLTDRRFFWKVLRYTRFIWHRVCSAIFVFCRIHHSEL